MIIASHYLYFIDGKAQNGHRRFDVGSFNFFLLSNDYTIHNVIYQLISCHKACPLNECVDFTLKIHLNSMKNSCLHQNLLQHSASDDTNDTYSMTKTTKRVRTHLPPLLIMLILSRQYPSVHLARQKRLDYDFSLKKVPGQGCW